MKLLILMQIHGFLENEINQILELMYRNSQPLGNILGKKQLLTVYRQVLTNITFIRKLKPKMGIFTLSTKAVFTT